MSKRISFRNFNDNLSSFIRNDATVARIWQLQNRDGTLADDTDLSGKQPLNTDLTAIAALTPTNDDFIQRKSGVWTNRSLTQVNSDLNIDDLNLLSYRALGSQIQVQTLDNPFIQISVSTNLQSANVRFLALEYLRFAKTLIGVKFWQTVKGSYTASNNNRIGLYSYSGGTLALVASSSNDGTVWQTASSQSILAIPFSSSYPAAPGQYFVGLIYNTSAQTTAPGLGSGVALSNLAINGVDFTNSASAYSFIAATDLPSSQAMSGTTAQTSRVTAMVY